MEVRRLDVLHNARQADSILERFDSFIRCQSHSFATVIEFEDAKISVGVGAARTS